MHRGAINLLIPIIGFLFNATLASFSAAVDNAPSQESSANALRSALHLDENSSTGLVLVPELLDGSAQDPSHQSVSHLDPTPPIVRDPLQLIIDERKLAPALSRVPSTWQVSVEALAASRRDEDIIIDGEELGTGFNGGFRFQLANRSDAKDRFLNAWDVTAIGLSGEDSLSYDSHLLFVPEPYHYKASFVSVESNTIHRTQYKRRVRQEFLGIRYIDQSDSIERSSLYPYSPSSRQEARNRMLGLQVGLDQSWSRGTRMRFGWGAKAGVFYSRGAQAGYVYNGTANTFPLLLECRADLAFRAFEQAYLRFGLIGIGLEDQYQSRFAWQAPQSTHQIAIVGMRLGFDYTY